VPTDAEKKALHIGDAVKVTFGQFEGFDGWVQSLDAGKRIARVVLAVFGRAVPIDIAWRELRRTI
jgi:transcriptional antiterminator NusG